jgi:hypothetical protein
VRAYKSGDSLQATQTFNINVGRKKSVGLSEARLNASVKLYPNPTSANTLLAMHLESAEKVQVTIADVQGKVIVNPIEKDAKSGAQEIELPTASLQNGIYFINISVGGKSAQVKLVVMH